MERIDMMWEPVRYFLVQIGEFFPRVLLAILILVAGWLIAKAVRFAVVKALRAINFNVLTERAGIDRVLQESGHARRYAARTPGDVCDRRLRDDGRNRPPGPGRHHPADLPNHPHRRSARAGARIRNRRTETRRRFSRALVAAQQD